MSKAAAIRRLAALPMVALLVAGPAGGVTKTSEGQTIPATVAAPADLPRGAGFDFYVLTLSWSPAYCRAEGADANQQQCARGRDLGFVVHGLWPQFETGYPEFCPSREPDRVPSALGRDYIDMVPSMGLIGHQWRKHGTCTGLSQRNYFETLRAARDQVTVPAEFEPAELPARIGALEAEDAFIRANPGLTRDAIAVKCDRGVLREMRICMTSSLEFRSCREVDRNGCTNNDLDVPEPG